VPVALLVEDVGVDLLPQRAAGDPEQVGDLPAGERRRPRAEEELAGLAVEDDERQRRAGQPALLAKLGEPLV